MMLIQVMFENYDENYYEYCDYYNDVMRIMTNKCYNDLKESKLISYV